MTVRRLLILLFTALFLIDCTPKTTEQAQNTKAENEPVRAEPTPEEEGLSPCPKFRDAPDPDKATTNYVLYRDFLKAREWDQAFNYWQKVYEVAPAADGQRNTVYADGIRFYERFLREAENKAQQEAYKDRIFELYDEIDQCYPQGGYIQA
ncbi:MAG: hypothetical protein R3350_01910, partial [Saprospiraceae bacterium]|nr:hypothetical protein [Saprospiraceae bacterium]